MVFIGFIINGVIITLYNAEQSQSVGVVFDDVQKLETINNKLTEDIASKDSLTSFSQSSQTNGYIEDGDIFFLNSVSSVAKAY